MAASKPARPCAAPERTAARQPEAFRHVAFTPFPGKSAGPVHYTVKRGDSLHAIAQRFDVSLADLKTWNPVFRNDSGLRTGQQIVVKHP